MHAKIQWYLNLIWCSKTWKQKNFTWSSLTKEHTHVKLLNIIKWRISVYSSTTLLYIIVGFAATYKTYIYILDSLVNPFNQGFSAHLPSIQRLFQLLKICQRLKAHRKHEWRLCFTYSMMHSALLFKCIYVYWKATGWSDVAFCSHPLPVAGISVGVQSHEGLLVHDGR